MPTMELSDRETIESEVDRLAPFLHNIELPYGLNTVTLQNSGRFDAENMRLNDLIDCALNPLFQRLGSFDGMSILDVACNCGGLSFEAAKRGAKSVMGTDIVPHYINQALFLKRVLQTKNVQFQQASIDDSQNLGMFDATFCCGLLYHLENPVASMKALTQATRKVMLVDTQVLLEEESAVWRMNVVQGISPGDRLTSSALWRGESACQFKPSIEAVIQLLQYLGFDKVDLVPIIVDHSNMARRVGGIRTFIAYKS